MSEEHSAVSASPLPGSHLGRAFSCSTIQQCQDFVAPPKQAAVHPDRGNWPPFLTRPSAQGVAVSTEYLRCCIGRQQLG